MTTLPGSELPRPDNLIFAAGTFPVVFPVPMVILAVAIIITIHLPVCVEAPQLAPLIRHVAIFPIIIVVRLDGRSGRSFTLVHRLQKHFGSSNVVPSIKPKL